MENVKSILITINLIMYDYVELFINQEAENVEISSIAIADGGTVCFDEKKTFSNKNLDELASLIKQVQLPKKEDDSGSREWSLALLDENDAPIKKMSVDCGYWATDSLENVVEIIEQFFDEKNITEYIHNIIEA